MGRTCQAFRSLKVWFILLLCSSVGFTIFSPGSSTLLGNPFVQLFGLHRLEDFPKYRSHVSSLSQDPTVAQIQICHSPGRTFQTLYADEKTWIFIESWNPSCDLYSGTCGDLLDQIEASSSDRFDDLESCIIDAYRSCFSSSQLLSFSNKLSFQATMVKSPVSAGCQM